MLERLIEILKAGGTHSIASLSHRLDVSPELVEMMMEDLARMGYLSRMDASCSSKCESCPMSPSPIGSCSIVGVSGGVWTFTDR